MDIHKPKPWHGVREFLKEYVIIVVGVLTALGAEQTVEWLHRREEVSQARAALHREIADDAASAAYGAREDACYRDLLMQFAAWAKGGPKPTYELSRLRRTMVRSVVWDVAKSGAVEKMDLDERLALAKFYGQVANQNSIAAEGRRLSGELAGFAFLDRLNPQQAGALLQDVGTLRTVLTIEGGNWIGMAPMARELGVTPTPGKATPRLDALCAAAGGAASPAVGAP